MKIHEELQQVIQQLVAAKREYYQLRFDEESPDELGPPSSPAQIAKLEAILRKPLPSTYRAFLELHDGWSDFYGGAKLLAVEDHGSDWVNERLEYWNDLWDPDADNPFEHGAIPILLGEDENSFLVLDPRNEPETGQFVMYDYMQAEEHYEDFISYIRHALEVTQRLIDRETNGIPAEEAKDGEE